MATSSLACQPPVAAAGKLADDYPHVYDPANIGNVLIVRDEGRVVCSVGVWINEVEMGPVRLRVGGINWQSCFSARNGSALSLRTSFRCRSGSGRSSRCRG